MKLDRSFLSSERRPINVPTASTNISFSDLAFSFLSLAIISVPRRRSYIPKSPSSLGASILKKIVTLPVSGLVAGGFRVSDRMAAAFLLFGVLYSRDKKRAAAKKAGILYLLPLYMAASR